MKQSSNTLDSSNSFVFHFEIHNNLLCAHSHMKYRDRTETNKTKSLIVYVCKKKQKIDKCHDSNHTEFRSTAIVPCTL